MKKVMMLCLFLLLLAMPALAETDGEITLLEPIPWDVLVSPNDPDPACYLPDEAGYHDDSIDIQIDKFRAYDTTVMRVRVKLTDPSQFRTRLANPYPSKQSRHVSDMTKRANAVMGINGDWFMHHSTGIVYRNGVEYRMKPNKGRDTLIMDEQGDLHIIKGTTQEKWDAYISDGGTVVHSWTFGPGLVVDGAMLTEQEIKDITLDCGKNKETQRIAIGQMGPLEYLILATEGPENTGSTGLTIQEMAQLCYDNGMMNAYNLDGGSSSTVSLKHDKINSRSSHKIRMVGDCIWFATLVPSTK